MVIASSMSGKPRGLRGRQTIEAAGKAVAPGFINMLSWATESLLVDGRRPERSAPGRDARGHGRRLVDGPLNDRMKALEKDRQGDIHYDIDWTTLGEYLQRLERGGIAPNVTSFVGATTVRVHVLGEDDVTPDAGAAGGHAEAGARGHGGGRRSASVRR